MIQVPQTALASTLENGNTEHSKLTVDSVCTDQQYGSIALKCDDDEDNDGSEFNDSEHSRDNSQKKKRRGRRKSRESLGMLIRDVRSRTPSDRSGRGPRRG